MLLPAEEQDMFGSRWRKRLSRIDARIGSAPRAGVVVGTLALVATIGALDAVTGSEISVSVFYLLPIMVATWYVGGGFGTAFAVLSAAVWLGADLAAGHAYSHPLIPYWNAVVRLGFFFITTAMLSHIRRQLGRETALALSDPLTGLANRRAFYARIEAEMRRLKRYGHPLTVVYLDLDNLKWINDNLGHDHGDRVLRAVANALFGQIRASDASARLGGDEFGILLAETGEQAARAAAEKLKRVLDHAMDAEGWPVTFSIGVLTVVEPDAAPDRIIGMADALMYKVKRDRKNGMAFDMLVPEPRQPAARPENMDTTRKRGWLDRV